MCLKISYILRLCCVWNNICVHVCKITNWRFLIICNCIYIVINCGWNNNVAVKIVACWSWSVFTSSWLDRHGKFVFTINRPSFEWECNVTGRPIWFNPLKWTFSTCFRVVVSKQFHGRDVVWGFGKRTVGGARGWWLKAVTGVVLTSHFYASHKCLWKSTATLCRLCALYRGLTVLKLIW